MQTLNTLIGLTLALAIAAFILALWPVIADAPWEQEPTIVKQEPIMDREETSQAELCLYLVDAISRAGDGGVAILARFDDAPWKMAGCSNYFAGFAK